MNLLIVILIEIGAVAGTGFLTFAMLSNVVNQAKNALIQEVAIKAIESKTGINASAVKSLVGQKPMASDPGAAIGGMINSVTKNENFATNFANQLFGKIPKTARYNTGKIIPGAGATMAGKESKEKPALRKISGKATKIANGTKLKLTNSKINQKFAESKGIFTNGLNSVKNDITEFENGIKREMNSIDNGFKISKHITGVAGGIRYANGITNNESNALVDTWGNKNLMIPGEKIIADSVKHRHGGIVRIQDHPANDPLLTRLNAIDDESEKMKRLAGLSLMGGVGINEMYKSKKLTELVKGKKEGNLKALESYHTKQYEEAIKELGEPSNGSQAMLKQRMMLDVIKNASKDLDKATLLNATNTMYSSYSDKESAVLNQAREAAEERNKIIPLETIKTEIAGNEQYKTQLNKYIDTFGIKDKSELEKLKQEIYKEIAESEDSMASQTVFTSEERKQLQTKIDANIQQNVQYEVAKIENGQVQEYRKNNPEASLSEARNEVSKQNSEQNYKQALEDALKSIEKNTNTNTNNSVIEGNSQNNTKSTSEPNQNIIQQTTINQQMSGDTIINQQMSGDTQRNNIAVDTQKATSQLTGQNVTADKQQVVNNNSNVNNNGNSNSVQISETQMEEIANKVAGKTIVPFRNAINESNAWLEKLGNGDKNKGIDMLKEGLNDNKITKAMEEMLKDLGGGDAEKGVVYVKQAFENLNRGSRESIADTEYDNEKVYTLVESVFDNKAKDNQKIESLSEYKKNKQKNNKGNNAV